MEVVQDSDRVKLLVHPLLVSLVVKKICSLLDTSQLKACRLISHPWNYETLGYLNGKIVIGLKTDDDIRRFPCLYQFYKFTEFKFYETVSFTSAQIIWRDIAVYTKELHLIRVKWSPKELRSLLGQLVNLEALYLRLINEKEERPLVLHRSKIGAKQNQIQENEEEDISFDTMKNVKKLHFGFVVKSLAEETEESQKYIQLTKAIIAACPNVIIIGSLGPTSGHTEGNRLLRKALFINRMTTHSFYSDLPDFLEHAVDNVYQDWLLSLAFVDICSQVKHVTHLNFDLCFKSNDFATLSAEELKLQDVSLVVNDNVIPNVLREFVRGLAATLQTIKIRFKPKTTSNMNIHDFLGYFPPGANLSELNTINVDNFRGTLNFLEHYPNVKSLSLNRVDPGSILPASFPRIFRGDHSLKKFWISNSLSELCPLLTTQNITRHFPRLTSLKLEYLTDGSLRIIFKRLPFLRELITRNGYFTDYAVTGIESAKLKVLMQTKEQDYKELTDNSPVKPAKLRRVPFIGQLKHLETVEMMSPKLTEATIIFGLNTCKLLKKAIIKSRTVDYCLKPE